MKGTKNIRLKHYDYKSNGYYFVTICTDYKKPYLEIPEIKNIVVAEIARLNELEGIKIDYFVTMPNHIHLIIILDNSRFSLPEIVKRFKSKTTVFVKNSAKQGWQLQDRLWQPNYYEHIIRDETVLSKIREYIEINPHLE